MITGGAITVVFTVVKLATLAGTGIGLSCGFEWFSSFKMKTNKTRNHREGLNHGYNETHNLREKLRSERQI